MSELNPPQLTKDILPAVRANVLAKKIRNSAGWLFFWGIMTVVASGFFVSFYAGEAPPTPEPPAEPSTIAIFIQYGQIVLGLVLIVFALFCWWAKKPKTILLEAQFLIFVGIANIVSSFLDNKLPFGNSSGFYFAFESFIIGVMQLFYGLRQKRHYKELLKWDTEAQTIHQEEIRRVKTLVREFLKGNDDFFAGRIRLRVSIGNFLLCETAKDCRGHLFDDVAIIISRSMDSYFCIPKTVANTSAVNARGMAKIMTKFGKKRFTFDPVSILAWKRWASLPVTEMDIRRIVKRKKASLEILRVFLNDENPKLRAVALVSLKSLKNKTEAAAAAISLLDDTDNEVRATALSICKKLRLGGLQERVIPMLKALDSNVRHTACEYIAAYPDPSAAEPLKDAMQSEPDRRTHKQMAKALKVCEEIDANPYGMN